MKLNLLLFVLKILYIMESITEKEATVRFADL